MAHEKIGEPSTQAIEFAERMIALKWTKETRVDIVAGNWQAGYVAAQVDAQQQTAQAEKEILRLKGLLKNLVEGIWGTDPFRENETKEEYWQQFCKDNNLLP